MVGRSDAPILQGQTWGRKGLAPASCGLCPLHFTAPALCRALGKAYSLGRAEYGRLGLGEGAEEKSTPTVIPDLPSISSVACGASVGYAVSSDGECWGLPATGGFWSCPIPFPPLILPSQGSAHPFPELHHTPGWDSAHCPHCCSPQVAPSPGAAAAHVFLWALHSGVCQNVLSRWGCSEN